MIFKVTHITILVRDEDEALRFYTQKLGFLVAADFPMEGGGRWLTVKAPQQTDLELVLMKADTPEKLAAVGKQAAGHVLFVVSTDDCRKEYERLKAAGVKTVGEPDQQPWGLGAMFEDLYGNLFYLLQPSTF
jgi:catechol 2,3-dioxygenase-like lactoylglutathione lyase family enzyme